MTDPNWYSDRSRYTTGLQQCLRKRYLTYHSMSGYGISPTAVSLTLETGIAAHEALALIMLYAKGHGHEVPPKEMIRSAILTATESYREKAKAGFSDDEAERSRAFTIDEQCALVEGLVWGWTRGQLKDMLDRFEILHVEEEMPLPLSEGIVWQARSDLVLLERSTQKLSGFDWKTTSSRVEEGDDKFVEGFSDDLQLAMNALAIEHKLGMRVEQFFVGALLKGGRGRFRKKGQEPKAEVRQYSDLLYAKLSPPSPPMQREWRFDTSGYWWDKAPLWQQGLAQQPQSPIERWVGELMPLPTLQENFALLGPYPRPSALMSRLPAQILAHEGEWIQRLTLLHDGTPWHKEEFQAKLDALVPPSWQCRSYGERCAFLGLCKQEVGWESPLEGGRFKQRVPHHAQELGQMTERLGGGE